VLVVVAWPLEWWKFALVATTAALFLVALLVPFGRSFFGLDPTNGSSVMTAVVVALAAVAVIGFIRRLCL
jgi:cation-transporting P-type ATPase E